MSFVSTKELYYIRLKKIRINFNNILNELKEENEEISGGVYSFGYYYKLKNFTVQLNYNVLLNVPFEYLIDIIKPFLKNGLIIHNVSDGFTFKCKIDNRITFIDYVLYIHYENFEKTIIEINL